QPQSAKKECGRSRPRISESTATAATWTTATRQRISESTTRIFPSGVKRDGSGRRRPVGGGLQCRQVELAHLQHRLHRAVGALRVGVREHLFHAGRHHLPGEAEAVPEPTALALLSAVGELLPEVVDLILGLAFDRERDRLVEAELRAAVDADEPLAVELELDCHHHPRLARARLALA